MGWGNDCTALCNTFAPYIPVHPGLAVDCDPCHCARTSDAELQQTFQLSAVNLLHHRVKPQHEPCRQKAEGPTLAPLCCLPPARQ